MAHMHEAAAGEPGGFAGLAHPVSEDRHDAPPPGKVMAVQYKPVFIDGPLKGKCRAVDERAIHNGIVVAVPPDISVADLWSRRPADAGGFVEFPQVHYRFHWITMFGRVLIVGTTLPFGSPEAEAAVFEALTTDATKDAVVEVLSPEVARVAPPPSMPVPCTEPSSQLSPGDALRLIDQAIAEQANFAKPPRQRSG